MELHQRTLLEQRSFFLLNNKIKLYHKDTAGESENYISYESLLGEAKVSCRKNPKLLFIAMAMMGFAACILLSRFLIQQKTVYLAIPLAAALFASILYQYRQQNYIILNTRDRSQVIFFRDKPNRRALEKFLVQLWLHRKRYLREKYFYINRDRDLDRQTERLKWLLEQQIITKSEYNFAQEDWIIDRSYQPY